MLLHELQFTEGGKAAWRKATLKSKSGKRVVVQQRVADENEFILGYGISARFPAYCWVYSDVLDAFTTQALLFAFLEDEVAPEFMARGF